MVPPWDLEKCCQDFRPAGDPCAELVPETLNLRKIVGLDIKWMDRHVRHQLCNLPVFNSVYYI